MRKVICFILSMFSFSLVQGEKIGVLSDVLKPEAVELSDDKLYVVEGATFFVYSLKDLKFITKFGQKGEGPGELRVVPIISNSIKVLPDNLFVEGLGKVIYFSKDFKFLTELKKKGQVFQIVPIDKNFAAIRMLLPEEGKRIYLSLSILDSEMNVVKELYKQEIPERGNNQPMIPDSIHFAVYKDKIFVEESDKGFFIEIFDSTGKKLYEIKKSFKAPKVTEKDKKAIVEEFKNDKLIKLLVQGAGGWDSFKKSLNFVFSDTFPPIKDILVTDDKIYVATFEITNNKEKYIVMDLKGNILNTPYLPIAKQAPFSTRSLGRDTRFYTITNNKFYYLKENEDEEEWELHVEEIK